MLINLCVTYFCCRDIFSILRNNDAFQALNTLLINHLKKLGTFDVVAALESRGFLFGPTIALEFGLPFVPIRKKGKLPGKVNQVSFTLEYGSVSNSLFYFL